MKVRNTITKLITISMVVAMAVAGSLAMEGRAGASGPAAPQNNLKQIALFSPPIGFIPGQTLRFSVRNPNAPARGSEPARVQVRLYDAQGNVLAQSEEKAVPAGQFRSFDFNRDDLRLAGEPATGRLQVRAGVGALVSVGGSSTWFDHAPVSMELIENSTGKTEVIETPAVGFHFFVEI
jgi:hypothetical protein